MIVTVANAKGGVAKTTTAVYLCAAHGRACGGTWPTSTAVWASTCFRRT